MQHRLLACGLRIVFGLLVFAVLATAILSRPAKWLGDFDQSFYLTIAYDLNHHGVFSNGVFDKVNSTVAVPSPGIFFGPIYPWLIVAATKIDDRFSQAVDCSVQANASAQGSVECDVYALPMHIALVGLLFGLLCLTRPSFVVLAPLVIGLIAVNDIWLSPVRWRAVLGHGFAFALAWLVIVGPWLVRNAISAGKWGLTEEYGSATLIERFAFDDMTAREFVLAFPYCLPGIGEPVINWAFGPQAMARFVYDRPGSFFEVGRLHRDKLVEAHGRLDPLIKDLVRDEMAQRWWRYLLVSLPLAWCGMWVGGWFGLALVPLFGCACVMAVRRSKPLFLLYAAPAGVMLALHAAVANHYTRYNLILIGPFAAGAAWVVAEIVSAWHR